MRTTIRIDDGLLADAKVIAAERRTTLNGIVEEALRTFVAASRRSPATSDEFRVAAFAPRRGRGGLQPGVDLDDTAALVDLMEADDLPV